ncbi:CRISPR-associated Cas1 family protein, partial [mine drainage metagenome]
ITLQNTLYIMTPLAYVHLDNATLRVDVEHEKRLQVPLHHVGALVCFGNVLVSPALVHRLADEGKALVLLDDSGRFKARMEGPVSGNILLRLAQHRAAQDPVVTLELARACVAGKIRNSRTLVQRGARETELPATPACSTAAPTIWPPRCAPRRQHARSMPCAASRAKPRAATSPRSTASSSPPCARNSSLMDAPAARRWTDSTR